MKARVITAILITAVSLSVTEGQPIRNTDIEGIQITAIMNKTQYRGAEAHGIIDAPPRIIWEVLTDYNSDPKYYPNTRESRVLQKEGSTVLVHKEMKFFFFSFDTDIKYREDIKSYCLTWTQVNGPFSFNTGTWTLSPLDRNRTRAIYRIELDHPLMTRWFAERLLKKNIPEMYRIINERVKRILGEKSAIDNSSN
jgi:ribosome-associated toxin RatA of RatAB toxin-antitoxin module